MAQKNPKQFLNLLMHFSTLYGIKAGALIMRSELTAKLVRLQMKISGSHLAYWICATLLVNLNFQIKLHLMRLKIGGRAEISFYRSCENPFKNVKTDLAN
jgi:hypothetical protein